MIYGLCTVISFFLSFIPPTGLSAIAHGFATFAYHGLRLRRSLILKNLTIAFGATITPAERNRIGYRSVYNFVLTILELLASRDGKLAADVTIEGAEHMRAAFAEERGVYILAMHMGNWEAMGAAVTREIRPSYVIVKKVHPPSLNRFVTAMRKLNGFLVIERARKGDGFRRIQEVFGDREGVGFVIDQARPNEPLLDFFGTPAKSNTSLAAIWRRLPAPIVPAYIVREKPGRHTLKIQPALQLTVTDDANADILAHSQYFQKVLEDGIRANPEHYFWMHDRWKV